MCTKIENKQNAIPWQDIRYTVFNIQCRIYNSTTSISTKNTRNLQRLLFSSKSAKFLAIRQTVGLNSREYFMSSNLSKLLCYIKFDSKVCENSCFILSNDVDFDIQLFLDLIKQYLAKLVLEPEWESIFTKYDLNSFGARPGYCAFDAIQSITQQIRNPPFQYVLKTSIIRFRDRISCNYLVQSLRLSGFLLLRSQIEVWSRAGSLDKQDFPFLKSISEPSLPSLLVNILLSKIPSLIQSTSADFSSFNGFNLSNLGFVRYGDIFVLSYPEITGLVYMKKSFHKFLSPIGLKMDPIGQTLTHMVSSHTHFKPGFDFLGTNVRYKRSNNGFYSLTLTPSFSNVNDHLQYIRKIVKSNKGSTALRLIYLLNPIIQGWCYYYRYINSSNTYSFCDFRLRLILRRWMVYRHPMKSWQWLRRKYFTYLTKDTRNTIKVERFFTDNYRSESIDDRHFKSLPFILSRHSDTCILRWVKVDTRKSFFDTDYSYWRNRLYQYPGADKELFYKEKNKIFSGILV